MDWGWRHTGERGSGWDAGIANDAGHHRRRFSPIRAIDGLVPKRRCQGKHDPTQLKTGVTSYLHIEKTSQQAIAEFYPYHTHYFDQLGHSRGRVIQLSRSDYERAASLEGAYFVGSPQQIIDKLLYQHELFGHQRFLAQIDIGGLPYNKVAQTIELLATEVAPVVRLETAKQPEVTSN